jgi:integrase/recombinase XerD
MSGVSLRERYRAQLQVRGYSERTVKAYVDVVTQLSSRTGELYPGRITDDGLEKYLASLLADHHYAPDTYGVHVVAIRHFFDWVLNRKMPVLEAARRQHRETLPVVLTYPETQRLLQQIKTPRLYVAAMTIYGCGLRISELRGMQTDWIMGDRGLLHIKNGKGGVDRVVPLPQRILDLLRTHWRRERPSGNLVFASSSGCALSGDSLSNALKAAAQEVGIPREPHPHTLRHCFATHLLERGVSLPLIQRWLGHKNIQTTAIYAQITEEHHQDGRAVLERMIVEL